MALHADSPRSRCRYAVILPGQIYDSSNHQAVIDADTCPIVVVGRPLPGNTTTAGSGRTPTPRPPSAPLPRGAVRAVRRCSLRRRSCSATTPTRDGPRLGPPDSEKRRTRARHPSLCGPRRRRLTLSLFHLDQVASWGATTTRMAAVIRGVRPAELPQEMPGLEGGHDTFAEVADLGVSAMVTAVPAA